MLTAAGSQHNSLWMQFSRCGGIRTPTAPDRDPEGTVSGVRRGLTHMPPARSRGPRSRRRRTAAAPNSSSACSAACSCKAGRPVGSCKPAASQQHRQPGGCSTARRLLRRRLRTDVRQRRRQRHHTAQEAAKPAAFEAGDTDPVPTREDDDLAVNDWLEKKGRYLEDEPDLVPPREEHGRGQDVMSVMDHFWRRRLTDVPLATTATSGSSATSRRRSTDGGLRLAAASPSTDCASSAGTSPV